MQHEETMDDRRGMHHGPPPPYAPPQYHDIGYASTEGHLVNDNARSWPSDPPSAAYGYSKRVEDDVRSYPPYPTNNYVGPDANLGQQQFQQQQTVIIQQPGMVPWGIYQGPLADPPNDYMCYSVFVTLCCCWLVGIFAIMRSAECRAAAAAGDRVTAEMKSREARSKAHLALCLGIVSSCVVGAIIGVYYGVLFRQYRHM